MVMKYCFILLFTFLFSSAFSQSEFITVWKPGTSQEIIFPGRGTNFNVNWEEIGYPQHTGSLTNVNSNKEFNIQFGTPQNPIPANATYRVSITNGNGAFRQVRFFDSTLTPIYSNPDSGKIINIQQWGNIQWTTMEDAFVFCQNMNITATDSPNLTQVTSLRQMFYLCSSLVGNPSFGNWNTSSVTTTYYMFGAASQFNQPIGSWNVSNVTDMDFMFDEAHTFNQSLAEWNTSKVTSMEHMFHAASNFNGDVGNWDVSKVTNMKEIFLATPQFNQNLGNWNLSALVNAENMLSGSGLNCQNYDSTLFGWKNNSNTPNTINFGTAAPQVYTHPAAVAARNTLTTTKGWTITGDTHNPACNSILATQEKHLLQQATIYPNPASEVLFLRNLDDATNYQIVDVTGRIVIKNSVINKVIDIRQLLSGNYILQIIKPNGTETFKFIKK